MKQTITATTTKEHRKDIADQARNGLFNFLIESLQKKTDIQEKLHLFFAHVTLFMSVNDYEQGYLGDCESNDEFWQIIMKQDAYYSGKEQPNSKQKKQAN